jgi:lysyl-tRNA synthetase class 1
LLNLVSAGNAHDKDVLWAYLARYIPGATPEKLPELDRLVGFAVRYFEDYVRPAKKFRAPSEKERKALALLSERLKPLEGSTDGKAIQDEVYAVGNEMKFEPLRDWFKAIYQVLFGEDQGPRFGSFVALYGVAETRALIERALKGELVAGLGA